MLNIKGSWLKVGVAILAVLMGLGIAYATQVGLATSVQGGPPLFSFAVSNDDGTGPHSVGGFTPIDPGNYGNDPLAGQSPSHECARADADVASATVSGVSSNNLNVVVTNAYPGYRPTIFFGLKNYEPTLGMITQINISNPGNNLDVSVQGIHINQSLAPGAEVVGSVEIQLRDSALQGQTGANAYTATVTILTSQTATVSPLAFSATSLSLPSGKVGVAYNKTMLATGGVIPYTWTATGLPANVTISTGGVISGIPTTAGTYSVSVKVTDAMGNSVTKSFSVRISP